MSELAEVLVAAVLAAGEPEQVEGKARFFKAGGQAGGRAGVQAGGQAGGQAGDRFAGVRVPVVRQIARSARGRATPADAAELLRSEWHEVRLLGAVLLVELYRTEPEVVVGVVLANTTRFDNWDLVDSVAPYTLGPWLVDHPEERGVLDELLRGPIWDRRIALVATFALIRAGEFDDTLRLAEAVLDDPEDLIHKAAGWMLRELGNRDRGRLDQFLDRHAARMPRVMLRYAIEKHSPAERQAYLKMKK